MKTNVLRCIGACVLASILLAPVSGWAVILIDPTTNHGSFESPETGDPDDSGDTIGTRVNQVTGWTAVDTGWSMFTHVSYVPNSVTEGEYGLSVNHGVTATVTSDPITNALSVGDALKLTFDMGTNSDQANGGVLSDTWEAWISLDGGAMTSLGTQQVQTWTNAPSREQYSQNYVVSANASTFQVEIQVRNSGTGNSQAYLDNVVLETVAASVPPAVTEQPEDVTRVLGDSTAVSTFDVVAVTADPPLTYQWRKDGVALAGETSDTLSLVNADVADYDVIITSAAALSTTSTTATVVETLPAIDQGHQTVSKGDAATVSITMGTGSSYTYQWLVDGASLGSGGADAAYNLASAVLADAGFYSVEVTYDGRTLTSEAVGLEVAPAGSLYLMSPLYQNGSFEIIDPHTAPIASGTRRASNDGTEFTVANWSILQPNGFLGIDHPADGAQDGQETALANSGSYGGFLSDPIPVDLADGDLFSLSMHSVGNNENTDFDVTLSLVFDGGTPVTLASYTETAQQTAWAQHTGVYVRDGAASSVQVLVTMDNSNFGDDQCYVDNILIAQTASTGPVVFEEQPVDTTRILGDLSATSTFSVVASGQAPRAYQWRQDGVAMPSETNSMLVLVGGDVADYDVIVSNPLNSVTSDAATIVEYLPAINEGSQMAGLGEEVTFSISMPTGSDYSYEWRLDGTPTGSSVSSQYIALVTAGDAGEYTVAVTYDTTTLVSDPATLGLYTYPTYLVEAIQQSTSSLTIEALTNDLVQGYVFSPPGGTATIGSGGDWKAAATPADTTVLGNGDINTQIDVGNRSFAAGSGDFVEYYLDVSTNSAGYDITYVSTIASWWDRTGHAYTLSMSKVGETGFTMVTNIAPNTFAPFQNNVVNQVIITEAATGVLMSNVDAIRFDFVDADINWNIYREIDILGVPSVVTGPRIVSIAGLAGGLPLEISWDSVGGKTYDVEAAIDLEVSNWTVIASNLVATPPLNTFSGAHSPAAGAESYRVIEKEAPAIFFDDFEGADTWTVVHAQGTTFERGTPAVPGLITNAASGVSCWGTGLAVDNFENFTLTAVRSPTIDLGGAATATLSFSQWRQIEDLYGTPTAYATDAAIVNILDPADLNGTPLAAMIVGNYTTQAAEPEGHPAGGRVFVGESTVWGGASVELPPAAVANGSIVVEFVLDGDFVNAGDYAGWYLDDVEIK